MPIFTTGTMAEELAKQNDWTPLKENLYYATVVEAVMDKQPYTDWSSGSPVKTDQMVDNFRIEYCLTAAVDGSPLVDINGNPPKKPTLREWLDPAKVGWNKKDKMPQRTRSVLTAILGVPVEAPIVINSMDDLMGKEVKIYVEVGTKKDGSKKNIIKNISTVEKKSP